MPRWAWNIDGATACHFPFFAVDIYGSGIRVSFFPAIFMVWTVLPASVCGATSC